MKKTLLIAILFFVAVYSHAYYDYWNGRLYKNGPYVNELISSYPTHDHEYIQLSKQYITDGRLSFSTSFNLRWDNFHRKLALNHYWGTWYIVGFRYQRNVYVYLSGTTNYIELVDLRVEDGYFDVSDNILWAESHIGLSSYSSQANSAKFYEELSADVKSLIKNKDYSLYVVYQFTPVPLADHDNYHYDPAETEIYISSSTVVVNSTQTGATPVFKVAETKTNSVINVNGRQNPLYNTGSGDRYIVYNSPDAIISVVADTVNLPCTVNKISGTSTSTYIGYGTFVASIGANSIPTDIDHSTDIRETGCGVIYSGCSRVCNSVTKKYIAFLNDMTNHKIFLQLKGYDTGMSCYHTLTNVLKLSLNSRMTEYAENTVEEFTSSCNVNYRMSRIYHLRDFSHVNVYTGIQYGSGALLKIQNSNIYTGQIDYKKNVSLKNILALGYEPYGPSYIQDLAEGKGITSNILEFEVVSAVTVPSLSAAEKAERLTCVTDSLNRDGDFIHLEGKTISCGNYSPTLYAPVYMWEVSFDGQKWEPLTEENYSKYIIDRYNVKFAVVMDSEKDLLLRSTILKNKSKAMFRQMVVLKSFESNEYSPLYSYAENGRYYIAVHASTYYTYIPIPILDKDNIEFSPKKFPQQQYLCRGDALPYDKINFRLVKSTNVSQTDVDRMEGISSYKIYELIGDSVGKIVSNTNTYTMSFKGEDAAFRCVISWCRDSLYKDVWVYANPDEKIELDKASSNVVISERDEQNGVLSLLCQGGRTPSLTVNDSNTSECTFYYRRVVAFEPPQVTVNDFSKMSRSKIVSFMNSHGWDYEQETGTTVENAGLDVLRSWCRVKEDSENAAIVDNARAENERLNAWREFENGNSTVFDGVGADSKHETLYIHKQNKATLCYSPDVRLEVEFFDGIENNTIAFASASDVSKSILYVPVNTPSPAIKGASVSGGYGGEYTYRYIYKENGGVWQLLPDDGISLQKNAILLDRDYQIARVVISRKDGDMLTQVCDTSNVLTLVVYEELDKNDVIVSGGGQCAGSLISAGISNYDPPKEVSDVTKFVWSASDPDVDLVLSGEMDRNCLVYNTKSSFILTVYREDSSTGVKTTPVSVPVDVVSVKPSFTLKVGDRVTNILDYPDETFTFQSGTRFELQNNSAEADSYIWNLELQYYTGVEVEGLTSYLENPVCYLYNPGQNKIRLTAKNSLGCESSVTAENIYIQSSALRRGIVYSHFDEDESEGCYIAPEDQFDVFPTITEGEDVNVVFSGGGFQYTVISSSGTIIANGTASHSVRISFTGVACGLYTIVAVPYGNESGDISFKAFKIIRK